MVDMVLAFEGGGSKTRILLADYQDRVYAVEHGTSSSRLYIQTEPYLAEITRLLRRVKRLADRANGRVRMAGLAGPLDWKLVTRAIRSVFGRVKFALTGEGDIALALHDLDAGVSLVAGTGSSCRALNENGEHNSCGGFGPQFGDEGSGYWIGREAIAAVVRARDGRGPETRLTKQLLKYLHISKLWEIHENPNGSGHLFPPRVAAFTPHVFDAAREGDAVARGICRAAGRELAGLVVAATRHARIHTRPIPLVLTGGVFEGNEQILRPFKQALRGSGLKYRIYPPVSEPVMGIVKLLARQREGKLTHVS